MSSDFYLPRCLSIKDTKTNSEQICHESQLLEKSKLIIILGEPGIGKSRLLESFAKKLNTNMTTANVFNHLPISPNKALIIDALDELVQIESGKIYDLLGKIRSIQSETIILSSRSSEWESSYTNQCKKFLDVEPLIAYLHPFNTNEKQQFFQHHFPIENFTDFQQEIERFHLSELLANPQFLELFTKGYIESGRKFTDKKSIFTQAIEYLAKEANPDIPNQYSLSTKQKIPVAEQVLATLLLSGSEGISSKEINKEPLYPFLEDIYQDKNAYAILASKLFRPSIKPDQHRPAHKIIAEYCAAQYLVNRINDNHNPLSLRQCLAIVAPNNTVRDELRGMVAWMATLGNQMIQETIIDLDPYAIIANGDPAQLSPLSKKRLLNALQKAFEFNPNLRRSDIWHKLNSQGFLSIDLADELKSIITQKKQDIHFRILILQLLEGSEASRSLETELCQLVLSSTTDSTIRYYTNHCLLSIPNYNYQYLFNELLQEASQSSLSMIGDAIYKLGFNVFQKDNIKEFLLNCANLYPNKKIEPFERIIGERYFIYKIISILDLKITVWLLNKLTHNLACICNQKLHDCYCREGISKIIGHLLDHYFDLAHPPFNALQIWQWIKNLNYHYSKDVNSSSSVRVLHSNNELRQEIIKLAFENKTDKEEIRRFCFYNQHLHAGLAILPQDRWFIINWAFEAENFSLWSEFLPRHSVHHSMTEETKQLRKHMKQQSLKNPEFLRLWVKHKQEDKEYKQYIKSEIYYKINQRWERKNKKKKDIVYNKNIQFIQENRVLVESGKHWGCLIQFADCYLSHPEQIKQKFGDELIVKNALYNCLDFIESSVPNLDEQVELKCESKISEYEIILRASCMEIFRRDKTLLKVKKPLLEILRTRIDVHFRTFDSNEINQIKREIDEIIFPDIASKESFLRRYIEPLLERNYEHTPVSWLRYDETFESLQSVFSLEWLAKFPNIHLELQKELFIQSVLSVNHQDLINLIKQRCLELDDKTLEETQELKNKQDFWFLRGFYFLENWQIYWDKLKQDKDNVFLLRDFTKIAQNESEFLPELSLEKIEAILEAFVEIWLPAEYPSGVWSGDRHKADAYWFLQDVVAKIVLHQPNDALSLIEQWLNNPKYQHFDFNLKSMRAELLRQKSLQDFSAPSAIEIVSFFERQNIVTVEALRALVLDELDLYQRDLDGGETSSKDIFYNIEKDKKKVVKRIRLGEEDITQIVAGRLRLRLDPKSITITPEHQMNNAKRCDITCAKVLDGKRLLLPIEAKGQWHPELFSAPQNQLDQYYAIHPDAEYQGIYLVYWFGENEKIAGKTQHSITTPEQLKLEIEKYIPRNIEERLKVFILDMSVIVF